MDTNIVLVYCLCDDLLKWHSITEMTRNVC